MLRPGGLAVSLEITHPPSRAFSALFQPFFYRFVPLLGAAISGDRQAYSYLPNSLTRFPTAPRLAARMMEAGFSRVTYRYLSFGAVAVHVAEKESHPAPHHASGRNGGDEEVPDRLAQRPGPGDRGFRLRGAPGRLLPESGGIVRGQDSRLRPPVEQILEPGQVLLGVGVTGLSCAGLSGLIHYPPTTTGSAVYGVRVAPR